MISASGRYETRQRIFSVWFGMNRLMSERMFQTHGLVALTLPNADGPACSYGAISALWPVGRGTAWPATWVAGAHGGDSPRAPLEP